MTPDVSTFSFQVNDVKSAVRDQESDLQEQLTFLANEKDNLAELERHIADLVNISVLTDKQFF
jgi:hypothetical protein